MLKKLGIAALVILAAIGLLVVVVALKGPSAEQKKAAAEAAKEAAKPNLPVMVGKRAAILGPGLVIQFKNISPSSLSALATFENPTTGQTKTFNLTLDPNIQVEIGHAEGWTGHSGDKVSMYSAKYRRGMWVVP
jgi:hypothetical protein